MEANLQSNFNVGFTNMKSDVLVHLTQWQYWWWFWFSLLWAFYYLMILKMVRFRSLKFRPRIATTFRPHGKWGDLIVCVIPVSWCANIITNSNFILRMIEWQSESGLLAVRIRGKQWYWVYKFELKTFTDVFTVPKNVGHNKWQISTPNDLQVADDYLHILQLRSQNRWAKTYWEDLTKEVSKSKNFHLVSPQEQLRYNFFNVLDERDYNTMFMNDLELRYGKYVLGFLERQTSPEIIDEWSFINYFEFFDVFLKNNVYITKESFKEAFFYFARMNPSAIIDSTSADFFSEESVKNNFFDEDLDRYVDDRILFYKKDRNNSQEYVDISSLMGLPSFLGIPTLERNLFLKNFISSMAYVKGLPTIFYSDLNSYLYNTNMGLFNQDQQTFVKDFWEYYTFDTFVKDFFGKIDVVEFFKNQKLFNKGDDDFDLESDSTDTEISNVDYDLNTLDEILLDSDDFFVKTSDMDFKKKSFLSQYNEDFYVRLKNKKSNWDESSQAGFSDTQNIFFSNDDIFLNRDSQVEKKNFFLNLNDDLIEEFDSIIKFEKLRDSVFYNYSDFNEFDRFSRKTQGTNSPLRLIKYPVSNKTNFDFNSEIIELFRFRYNDSDVTTEHRTTPNSAFLIVRQKRYKRRKVILPRTIFYKDSEGNPTKKIKSSNYTFLSQNKIILENDFNATKRYKFFRKNKVRDELTNLVLSKRILRTRRTLVLPAHLNITAITNSFDVIHSWFIPGLGLKMDAIPGRATHHTFYIDNVGFYYGQCAEICGRYHHHMPIRICALPFEHFLLWWQSFGLPKLLFTKNFRKYSYSYGSRKYAW